MHVGFTVTSPPEHRGLYGCAPVAFASEESSPPGITTAQLVEADELYLSQLNLLRPNASGANASAALAARIRGRAVLVAMNELWPPYLALPFEVRSPVRVAELARRAGALAVFFTAAWPQQVPPFVGGVQKVALPACTAWHADGAALRAALAAGDNVTVSLPRYRRYSYADEPLPEHMITSPNMTQASSEPRESDIRRWADHAVE